MQKMTVASLIELQTETQSRMVEAKLYQRNIVFEDISNFITRQIELKLKLKN